MIPIKNNTEIVITGVGVVNAISNNFNEFISSMKQGECGLSTITEFSTNGLRNVNACGSVNFNPKVVYDKYNGRHRKMERSSELVMSAYFEALAMSGLNVKKVSPDKGAVVLGSTLGGALAGQQYYKDVKSNKHRPSKLRDYSMHSPGYRICIDSGFLGPNLLFSSACTSSNQALASAIDLISYGKSEVVIAGGFDVLSEVSCSGFSAMRNVSPNICSPFDVDRQGLMLGEGSAILIIESSESARKRGAKVLATLKGYGVTSDAFHMTAPDSKAAGPIECMKKAILGYEDDVDLIVTHGTGTIHNDKIEAKAIHNVFGQRGKSIACTSIKSMVGHTLGAAGAMNAIAAIAGGVGGFIPPTVNFKSAEKSHALSCSGKLRSIKPKLALSNTLGFGGVNCSILIGLN